MAKPIVTQLQEAVKEGNMFKIQQLTERLAEKNKNQKKLKTTKIIKKPPPKKRGPKKKIQEKILDSDDESSYITTTARSTDTDSGGRRSPRSEPFRPKKRKNQFVDDYSLATEDIGIPLTRKLKARPKAELVEAICNTCGKRVKASRALVSSGRGDEACLFKCNGCCTGGKR